MIAGDVTPAITPMPSAGQQQLDLEYVVQEERSMRIRQARMKGYEGDACGECGNFTLLRNGTCMKCDTCGGTSGCS
jgi:ribonucleoside-diphosphate reductase alpha chain